MLTNAPLPKLKHFFTRKICPEFHLEKIYKGSSRNKIFWTRRSVCSLDIISRSFKDKQLKEPVFLIPNYICHEVYEVLKESTKNVFFYEINYDYSINKQVLFDLIEEKRPHFIIFVNFFGMATEIKEFTKICKKNEVTIIEDSTHVVVPHSVIGVHSDISLYSPYKHFPIPDGAALVVSKDYLTNNNELRASLDALYLSSKKNTLWVIKKLVQYIFRVASRESNLSFMQDPEAEKVLIHEKCISIKSLKILSNYEKNKINQIQIKRNENSNRWRSTLSLMGYSQLKRLENTSCFFVRGDVENSNENYKRLKKLGARPATWPTLPKIESIMLGKAKALRNTTILLPNHQDIESIDFIKILKKTNILNEYDYSCEEYVGDDDSWNILCQKPSQINILQTHPYAQAHEHVFGQKKLRYVFKKNDHVIGYSVAREKRIGFFKIVIVNRGPIIFSNDLKEKLGAISSLKKKIKLSKLAMILIFPEIRKDDLTRSLMREFGLIKLPFSNHHSSQLNLNLSLNEIRRGFNSKWRNLLKKSESFNVDVKICSSRETFFDILDKYDEFKKNKNFDGLPSNIMRKYFEYATSFEKPVCISAFKEGKFLSSVIMARYGTEALYLIAVNTEEGREKCSNYLLLWKAVEHFKKEGVNILDLGGIDEVNNPLVAHFKKQMKGDEYKLVGGYLAFSLF